LIQVLARAVRIGLQLGALRVLAWLGIYFARDGTRGGQFLVAVCVIGGLAVAWLLWRELVQPRW